MSPWLAILKRHDDQAIGWHEVVVGYDLGFLAHEDIQAWARTNAFAGQAVETLCTSDSSEPFQSMLWAACLEQCGALPRPGHARWLEAQDRWRLALLKDILATDLTPEALAIAVERLYEHMGCPEDMLRMLRPGRPQQNLPAVVDPAAMVAFLRRFERRSDEFVSKV
jgi:hypothetical protein